ncbi:hypothetical protein JCM1840_004851 [Sporobolomyces johnsonii]
MAPFLQPSFAYSPGYAGPAPPFAPGWGVWQQPFNPMPNFNPAAPPFHPTAPNQNPWGSGGGNGFGTGWNGDQSWGASTEGGSGEDLWSTGVYRPLPRRDRAEDRSSRSHDWRDRSPSPPPFLAANSSGPTDPNAPPARRKRTHQRSAPLPSPSAHYLAASLVPSTPLPPPAENEAYEPPLLMLDLNHTLLCRAARNRSGSKLPLVRPYLATFLEYICSDLSTSAGRRVEEEEEKDQEKRRRKPRFLPIVFSSARHPNVLSLLTALSLVPPSRLPLPPRTKIYTPSRREGDVLELVWTREMMGLDAKDFARDVETTKDLEGVWRKLMLGEGTVSKLEVEGGEGEQEGEETKKEMDERLSKARNEVGARRTILLDDEASKAAQQPHNHLPIAPFLVSPSDFPRHASLSPPPPDLPASSSFSSAPLPPPPPLRRTFQNGDIVPQALEFDASSTAAAARDAALLETIYVLERLTRESHIAGAMRAGFVERVRGDVREALEGKGEGEVGEGEVEEEMQRRGRKVCEELGIKVRREWDAGWRDRVVGLVGEGMGQRREGEKEEK